jgi:hypothetical protein
MADFPNSITRSEIEIAPRVKLVVHILDTGHRIVEEESFMKFIDWLHSGGTITDEIAAAFAKAVKGD